jgi:hypothetical protein
VYKVGVIVATTATAAIKSSSWRYIVEVTTAPSANKAVVATTAAVYHQ